MKRKYMTPALCVLRIEQTRIICDSKVPDVIPPGQPNEPAGARRHHSVWDEDEE